MNTDNISASPRNCWSSPGFNHLAETHRKVHPQHRPQQVPNFQSRGLVPHRFSWWIQVIKTSCWHGAIGILLDSSLIFQLWNSASPTAKCWSVRNCLGICFSDLCFSISCSARFPCFAAFWSWKLPFQPYLEHFGVLTSYSPWSLQHFGARTVHAARYLAPSVHFGLV